MRLTWVTLSKVEGEMRLEQRPLSPLCVVDHCWLLTHWQGASETEQHPLWGSTQLFISVQILKTECLNLQHGEVPEALG